MKVIVFVSLFIAGASSLSLRQDLGWEPCNDNNWAVGNVDLSPYPFPLTEGTMVDVEFLLDIQKEIDGDVDLDLKLVKKGIVDIPIPCKEVCHGVYLGSCSWKLEELLTKYSSFFCPNYVPEGQECSFPLATGHYGGKITDIKFPGVSDTFAAIAKGKFEAQISLKRNGEEIFCLAGQVELVK